jgi:hypothetical protein
MAASMGTSARGHTLDGIWNGPSRRPGHRLAQVSGAILCIDVLLLVVLMTEMATHAIGGSLHDFLNQPGFPLLLYAVWGLGVFGSAGAICAITVYGYRERWFWRWLVVASAAWLALPPVHTVIGLVALVALFHHRSQFSERERNDASP